MDETTGAHDAQRADGAQSPAPQPASALPASIAEVLTGDALADMAGALGVTALDPGIRTLDAPLLAELLHGLDAVRSALAALEARTVVALDEAMRASEGEQGVPESRRGRTVSHEVAMASRISPASASRRLGSSRRLVRHMPRLFRALASGLMTAEAAHAVGRSVGVLDPAQRADVDAALADHLPYLDGASPGQWAREVELVAHRLAPDEHELRARRARNDRSVRIERGEHGMAHLHAHLPALDAAAIRKRLDLEAEHLRAAGDRRGHSVIMADVLTDTLLGRDGAMDPVSFDVGVVITDRALLTPDRADAAVIDGYGTAPVSDLLERLGASARDGATCAGSAAGSGAGAGAGAPTDGASPDGPTRDVLRRLFTHPTTSELVAVESRGRSFPLGLRRMIRLRDQVCMGPYCGAPIRQIDHVEAASEGGPTSLANGNGLCARCNVAKEEAMRKVTRTSADGRSTTRWTSRLGSSATTSPPPLTAPAVQPAKPESRPAAPETPTSPSRTTVSPPGAVELSAQPRRAPDRGAPSRRTPIPPAVPSEGDPPETDQPASSTPDGNMPGVGTASSSFDLPAWEDDPSVVVRRLGAWITGIGTERLRL
ncbi:HNH endonuclease signature motif containing protein [Brachybacterium nesterenkovii]|uniref:HNH nuclease domain-containing protein n=1 Tax=Brachybacterium nesterenkovii TaxID=47847 RepID=A0A1X6WWB1_9MICO|nr:HNH endonuclease signature motif containing protein [Brachybacterium nesterenkovii]SLM89894.1 hypothetical protein FM110_04305 [Brachybacterium nesterenkovii]